MSTTTTNPLLLLLTLSLLLLLSTAATLDDDEDLSFLEEPKPIKDYPDYADPNYKPDPADAELYGSYDDYQEWGSRRAAPPPVLDEKDVVVLNKSNFGDFVKSKSNVMVEFYAPWCGYCRSLAPEYAAAASELKEGGYGVVLAKVNAIQEAELADEYKVEGFPSIFFFSSDGSNHLIYNGDLTKDAIVSWLKKKTGSAIKNVTTTEEAEKILESESKFVVAFIDSLNGFESRELDGAAKEEEDVNFYQTSSPDVAKLFHFDITIKRPAVVLLKNEAEKVSLFDGSFSKSGIMEFVSVSKHPFIINFTQDSLPLVFENPPIKKQVFLFATVAESEKLIPSFLEAAKTFKGKIMFVYIDRENEIYGKPLMDYFGLIGETTKVIAFTTNADGAKKYLFDGEITLDEIKLFSEDFLDGKLQPFYKSDPIPETNDGDVKVVVRKNFDEIVLDESKDVLLEIYAPWCQHCQSLEPAYNRLALNLKGAESIVLAKMDGTTNEHPRAKAEGFPTILFYPAGKKSSDPIKADTERSAIELYKFIKKHATTPFKIQKQPAEAPEFHDEQITEPSSLTTHEPAETPENYSEDAKDEL